MSYRWAETPTRPDGREVTGLLEAPGPRPERRLHRLLAALLGRAPPVGGSLTEA